MRSIINQQGTMSNNADFLDSAAELAATIDPHLTSPNPRVGCVIVRNGKIIAEGVHEKFGGAHAEANTFRMLQDSNPRNLGFESNLEVYITLEPCDHFEGKKTPSCTDLLLRQKPKKIVVGALDPQFQGKNLERLQKAGINVEFQKNKKCEELNSFFEKYITQKLPYVTFKMAQSLDGKVVRDQDSYPQGYESKYISNEFSRQKVHEMRAQYSAVLTTTKTILADDPLLNCRINPPSLAKRELEGDLNPPDSHKRESFPLFPFGFAQGRQRGRKTSDPQIIVLGKKEDIPPSAKIFSIPHRKIHWFDSRDLREIFSQCAEKGIDSILTECGPTLAGELLTQQLVDQMDLFVAPEIFGRGMASFSRSIDLSDFSLNRQEHLEGDVWLRFLRKK
ncbi:bifunctional diaminohydroxyphosphoribosylaminopyrimidine deaminase/5-amino-6-(5-phosphoribosylamino)uracil reductase RibD [Candidatus Gracilibacteria bacterium]|nr:bifunctional diaminohydroxyphosphoribosylaminopyrimidine deaminase/5-amino-6-(5-phosphoribosylamino)uracil reductase RibD [Candidatus Gracilibacteria bacterium]MCF7818987.1 bifunctional diaminohydroxyphosphoribosylaminopyrimidine deaminase/5-amino-6-(5-phosphoribosylamino)uracil reductase RibD [Candidatus Gracilibacteria bacterium]